MSGGGVYVPEVSGVVGVSLWQPQVISGLSAGPRAGTFPPRVTALNIQPCTLA